jgi:beta-phosphoglucomutase-like phosphatase (HAD superfamily)
MRRSPGLREPMKVAMFDLDGTLIDTMNGFADVAAAVMGELHDLDPVVGRRRYLETSGIPFRQQLDLILPDHAENDRASAIFEERKRAHADSANLDDATQGALEELRRTGMKIVVSSNSAQHFVDDFAARQPFRFDLVLGFDAATGFAKGRPHVDRTVRELGVTTSEIVFCGDSIKDGELAHACGLAFVARLGTFSHEDFRRWTPAVVAVADIAAFAELLATRAAA